MCLGHRANLDNHHAHPYCPLKISVFAPRAGEGRAFSDLEIFSGQRALPLATSRLF